MKKRDKSYFVLSFFLFVIFGAAPALFAQLEGRYWYFGDHAGIRFDAGGPVALEDGQLYTLEGSTTASTQDGELLFYSDGISVWNKNQALMPNGFDLAGNPSSTQSGLILPKPGAAGRYYLFTIASAEFPALGIAYSEIDMSLDGGLGDVIPETKNTTLTPDCIEKLTAVAKPDNSGYWVLSHNRLGNEFYAFSVTESGVNAAPIISAIGESYTGTAQTIGYLKFSTNAKWVGAIYFGADKVELFRFNPFTGTVTESVFLDSFGAGNAYGVEFSPNNKRFYCSNKNRIYQYDLANDSNDLILNSRITVGDFTSSHLSALQLGIDGKIYFANVFQNYIGVIPNPDLQGTGCGFIQNAVDLGTGICQLGLPTSNQSIFSPCVNTNLRFLTLFRKSYVCNDCTNGRVAASGIGGVKPYQYSLDGQNYQNSGVFNGLTPGLYTVFIRDAAGCMVSRKIMLGN